MAKTSPNGITSISQQWSKDSENGLPFSGDAVEAFIKKTFGERVGYIRVVTGSDGTSNVMGGFASEDDYLEWMSLSEDEKWGESGSAYLVTSAVLPSIEQSDIYTVGLTLLETPATIQASTDVTISVKGTSTVTYASGGTDTVQEDLQVTVQTRTSSSASWTTRGTFVIAANDTNHTEISLRSFLYSGTNYVRVRAVGENASSIWRSFTLNVVSLSLTPNNAFSVPFTGSTLSLNYLVGGSIAKTLQFEFGTGIGSGFSAKYSYLNNDPGCSRSVGTATNLTTGITYTFDDQTMMSVLMADGVHTVRARLYVSETVKTEWVESQYMVANGTDVKPVVIVNEVNSRLDNWTDVSFFKWAANKSMTVVFRLVDSAAPGRVYASWTQEASVNTQYELSTQLGIELDDPDVEEFYAYMHIYDANGSELADPIFFTFGNSSAFSPTAGADFILMPSDRANSETNPKTIINKATGLTVPSTWSGFGMVSDGWMDVNKDVDSTSYNAETIRALHIPAGRKLTVEYNPFSEFMDGANTGKHVTIEVGFRTNNILDDDEPIVSMCSTFVADGRAWGFEMLPKEAYLLTQRKRAIDDQNVTWAEGVRTRLTVNVVYGLNGLNYVRIFINEKIEREFTYTVNDIFVGENISMAFGNSTSDLDIFELRVYKKALSTDEVMQDYKASLPTVSEKLDFASLNDIVGDEGTIDFNKAKDKYNVLGLTGHLAKYGDENKGKSNGNSLYHSRPGDTEHTGTLTDLENSGQGTTAMTYFDWNQQQKVSDNTKFIPDNDADNPVDASGGWSWKDGEAAAKKLNGKINFASSMQGHKMGLCHIYTEVFKRLVSSGLLSEPSQVAMQPNARLAVYEEPYLFFHRETENDPWVFKYLMTWGAAKGDKPTFGYSNSKTPKMLMVEGANNDRPLALFRIPWNEDISYVPSEEAWMYNGQKQLNFGFGHTAVNESGEEYPDNAEAIAAHKRFFNFVYLHHQNIGYFSGTLTQLRASESVDKTKFYWVTQADAARGSAQYDIYRYDEITYNWVDAGVSRLGNGSYEKLNARTQYESFGGSAVWTQGQWDTISNAIVSQRTAHFKANASEVMHVDDCLYHSSLIKFFAGTDNRAKNTYYYTDPVTMKIRHFQDDVDTIIKTNNVGQNRKPYYVEEHDKNSSGEYYWQGEESGYYNLLETAFEDELTAMMNNILSAMASIGGSVMDYLVSRMLEAQDYFPGIAYNEMARLVYEAAAVAQEAGEYVNTSVQAITQSCGSQRWSEYDWMKNRVMYISSWCEYGEFAGSSAAANGLSWRGKNGARYNFRLTTAKWLYPRVGSDSGNYPASASGRRVRVPAGQVIEYPSITLSSDSWISIRGINYYLDLGDMNVGVSADQGTFMFYGKMLQKIDVNPDGSNDNLLLANSIGIANATNIKSIRIRNVSTASGEINLEKCVRLEEIDLRGSTFPLVELPASERLLSVRLPDTLTSLRIDAQPNLESVTMDGVKYLDTVYVDQSKAGTFDSHVLAMDVYAAKSETGGVISSARFYNVRWSGVKSDMLMYYSASKSCDITGSIDMLSATNDRYLSFSEVVSLIERFGNIQSLENPLYINYPKRQITGFSVKGDTYIKSVGIFDGWTLSILPTTGNNVSIENGKEAISWSFVGDNANLAKSYATFKDTVKGTLEVTRLSDNSMELNFTARVTMKLTDGSSITFDKKVGFYNRIPKIGDFAYYDGSFDNEFDSTKTLVGAVVDVKKVDGGNSYDVEVYAKENASVISSDGSLNTSSMSWGIYQDNAGSNGFPSTVTDEIAQMSGLDSATDTPVANASTTGISNPDGTSNNYTTIGDSFIDDYKDDGYADVLSTGCAARFDGKRETEQIIGHATAIITRYLMEKYPGVEKIKVPETISELGDAMLSIANANAGATNTNRYYQMFFPAALCANLYQPYVNDGEILDEQYRKNRWSLPAAGTLCRIYNFYYNSCGRVTYANGGRVSEEFANEVPETVARTPLFANLLKRIRMVTPANPFAMPTNSPYWSSTESSAAGAWLVYFDSGYVYGIAGSKSYSVVVRPVAVFKFNL